MRGTKIPFGAIYRCRKGHSFSAYFFDSKPEETLCVRWPCSERGAMANKVFELDMMKTSQSMARKRSRIAKKLAV